MASLPAPVVSSLWPTIPGKEGSAPPHHAKAGGLRPSMPLPEGFLWLRGRVRGAGADGAVRAAGVAVRMIRRSFTGRELCIDSRHRVAAPDCIGA